MSTPQLEEDKIKDPVETIKSDLGDAKDDLIDTEPLTDEELKELQDETTSLSTPVPNTQVINPTLDPAQPVPVQSDDDAGDDDDK